MNRTTLILLIGFVLVLGAGLTILLTSTGNSSSSSHETTDTFVEPHICAMHPHVVNEGPGECDLCGMMLSKLEDHKPGDPIPSVSEIFTSQSNMMYLHEGPGKDTDTGDQLIPITQSPIYEPPKAYDNLHDAHSQSHSHNSEKQKKNESSDTGGLYTCGMHPDVIQEEPGDCPICGMELTPVKNSGGKSQGGERKIAYWVAPMDPEYISDKPGKSPMGMDLVPVYEDELSGKIIYIDPATVQNIGVTTTEVEKRDLSRELHTNGIVKVAEDLEYRINSKVSGWIEKLYVARTGDPVNSGDALIEIYSPELMSAQEEYLLARKNAELLSNSGIGHVNEAAGNMLAAAIRRLELWDIDRAQIEELDRNGTVKRALTIHSPISGIVSHKNAIEGAAVKAGMDLFHIVDLKTLWIDAQVFENELPWVKAGDTVEVTSPYDPSLQLHGQVDLIYPFIDSKTRTAIARVIIRNLHLELRPDMYVDVRIITSPIMNAVAVPKNAVLRSGKRDVVFVALGEGRFLPCEVKVGLEAGEYYSITEGLSPGTSVVTSAQFLLDSEAKLQEAIQRRLQQRSMNRRES